LIISNEAVHLKGNISGICQARVSWVSRGLGHIGTPPLKPLCSGKILIVLHNYTTNPIPIYVGEKIALITLYEMPTAIADKKSVTNNILRNLQAALPEMPENKLPPRGTINPISSEEEDPFRLATDKMKTDIGSGYSSYIYYIENAKKGNYNIKINLPIYAIIISFVAMLFCAIAAVYTALQYYSSVNV